MCGMGLLGFVMASRFVGHIVHFFNEVYVLNVVAHELATLLDGLIGKFLAVCRFLEFVADGFFNLFGKMPGKLIHILFVERGIGLFNDRRDLSRRLDAGEWSAFGFAVNLYQLFKKLPVRGILGYFPSRSFRQRFGKCFFDRALAFLGDPFE